MEERIPTEKVRQVSRDIGCSISLARDLLVLAGGDEKLVREASMATDRVESAKAYIIDARFRKSEDVNPGYEYVG